MSYINANDRYEKMKKQKEQGKPESLTSTRQYFTSADEYIKKTITNMKKLGIWEEQYYDIVAMYGDMRAQYDQIMMDITFDDLEERTKIMNTVERLRKDISLYADMLGLTPKAMARLQKEDDNIKKSALDKALSKFNI